MGELHLRADDPKLKAEALAELLERRATDGDVEVGETTVASSPAAPGRPELHGELFSNGN